MIPVQPRSHAAPTSARSRSTAACTSARSRDPAGFWREQAESLSWFIRRARPSTPIRSRSTSRGSAAAGSTPATTASTATSRPAATSRRSSGPATSRATTARVTYRELKHMVCRIANVLLAHGVQARRPGGDLPADDPRARGHDARLRPHRRRALGGLRRLLGRVPARPDPRRRRQARGHRQRGAARRQADPAQGARSTRRSRARVRDVRCWWRGAPTPRSPMRAGRDFWLEEEMASQRSTCPIEWMHAESPLFTLYTSGSTGKPKGVLHTTGGYLLYAALTHELVFDLHEDDVYFCAADIGWVTGHSYIVYGPLANGATTVMFESIPLYPDAGRYWRMVDDLKATIFYTAPTALRAIAREGDAWVKKYSRKSPARPRHGRRADQPRGLEVVPRGGGRGALRGGRHLVADRDRRHPDHAAARRDADQAGLGDAAVLRRRAGAGRRRGQGARGQRRLGQPLPRAAPGRARRAPSAATTRASARPTSRASPASTSPATAAGATRTATTGSPAGWTTCSTSPATGWAPPRSRARWSPTPRVAEAAVVGFPHEIKGDGHLRLRDPQARVRERPTREELVGALKQQVRHAIGADRHARPHPDRARPAQDPLGEDHAPHPAQDRRRRVRRARRRHHARRPVGRRAHRRGSQEGPGLSWRRASMKSSSRRTVLRTPRPPRLRQHHPAGRARPAPRAASARACAWSTPCTSPSSVFINDDERGLHARLRASGSRSSPRSTRPTPSQLPPQPHRRRQRRRPPEAPDHGPRSRRRHHRRQARLRPAGSRSSTASSTAAGRSACW